MNFKHLIQSLTRWLHERGQTDLLKRLSSKQWSDKSIVYYVGNHAEGLTPLSLDEGASGSHSAVIYLCREWAKLGYEVTVYSKCKGQAGLYEGVEYIEHYNFNWYDRFNFLIIWRHPYLLKKETSAKHIALDWHDLLDPESCFPLEIIQNRINTIFSKSFYQRKLLATLPDTQFVVVSNGISSSILNLFSNSKNPYRLVYASRYYRGLEQMLTYGWPLIRKQIQEAELHVYYGFTKRDFTPEQQPWREYMERLLQQPGVINRGKISQHQLIEEKSKSSIHYYGCTFGEVDCISVRESAAVGCVPLTTDFAVLSEKDYCIKVAGDPMREETQVALAERIIDLLKNPEELERYREPCRLAAIDDTWDKIAKVWIDRAETVM